jgi:excisionase family DNA binding protein
MDQITVTISEAVRLSGLGRTTLYELLKSGELPKRKCGGKTLILVADLKRYLENLPAYQPN